MKIRVFALALVLMTALMLTIPAFADAPAPPPDAGQTIYTESTVVSTSGGWNSPDFSATPGNGEYIRFWFDNTTSERVIVYLCWIDSQGKEWTAKSMDVPAGSQKSEVYSDTSADSRSYRVVVEAIESGGDILGSVNVAQGDCGITPPANLYTDDRLSASSGAWNSPDFSAAPGNGKYIRFEFDNATSERVKVYLCWIDSQNNEWFVKSMDVPAGGQNSAVYSNSKADSRSYKIVIEALKSGGDISGSLNVAQYAAKPEN